MTNMRQLLFEDDKKIVIPPSRYTCPFCKREFKTFKNLLLHAQKRHWQEIKQLNYRQHLLAPTNYELLKKSAVTALVNCRGKDCSKLKDIARRILRKSPTYCPFCTSILEFQHRRFFCRNCNVEVRKYGEFITIKKKLDDGKEIRLDFKVENLLKSSLGVV